MVLQLVVRGIRAAWPRGIGALTYGITLMLLFAGIYQALDLRTHVVFDDSMKGKENNFLTSMYMSAMLQTNAMPDMTPRTTLMRVLFMMQVLLGWLWFVM